MVKSLHLKNCINSCKRKIIVIYLKKKLKIEFFLQYIKLSKAKDLNQASLEI